MGDRAGTAPVSAHSADRVRRRSNLRDRILRYRCPRLRLHVRIKQPDQLPANRHCHIYERNMTEMRKETDSLGVVQVPADKLWGAQTQRSLEHFSIGQDLIPREMINSYATLRKAAAIANHADKRLDDQRYKLIVQACDEILAGQHHDMFPLHVWMTGSGTQFNMNA